MVEQENFKRQVRYKDSIYDIIKDINLGGRNYLIIGKGSDARFYGIDFVEQRTENGKVKYISPNVNFQFHSNIQDFSRLQGQSLMSYIINEITDNINEGKLVNRQDTIHYIDDIARVIETSNDIQGFFRNNHFYDTEEQFDESVKILIDYYKNELMRLVVSDNQPSFPTNNVEVSVDDVNEIYDELENTQNFGASIIYDRSKESDEYKVDPTNFIYSQPKEVVEPIAKEDTTSAPQEDTLEEKAETNSMEEETQPLTFQQRMFLENEQRMQAKESFNIGSQTELTAKIKTKTLKNSSMKRGNAAYISISLLLYLIGSFELLLTIVLIAKYL